MGLQLACVLGVCEMVRENYCIFGGCIAMGSLEADICVYTALVASSSKIMSHSNTSSL